MPVRFDRTVLLLALLHAACRFVPVPLADDWLQTAVAKQLVRRALAAQGRSYPVDHVRPLFDPSGGCLAGCLGALPKLLLKVLLFPLRKILAWLGAVRGVTSDLTTMLLLSRSIDRSLARGRLFGPSEIALHSEALAIRTAFDSALVSTDLHLTRAALRAVLAGSKGLLLSAARAARSAFAQGAPQEVEGSIPEAERPAVVEGTTRLEAALATPEISAEILAFDQRFDGALSALPSAPLPEQQP